MRIIQSGQGPFRDGLIAYGLPAGAADIYVALLERGPQTGQALLRSRIVSPNVLENSLSLLSSFLLIGEQRFRDRIRYYATTPRIAWRWQEFRLVWEHVKSMVPPELVPSLDDPRASARIALIRRLKFDAMKLYRAHPHTCIEAGRGRQLLTGQEYAHVSAEAMSIAESSIFAVDKPPHTNATLPVFWAAITDRREAGVSYTRCVPLSEVLLHGIDTVERDIRELGIELRLLRSEAIRKQFYLVDDKYLLAKGDTAADQPVGYLSFSREQIARCRELARRAIKTSTPAIEVVPALREWLASIAWRAERRLGNAADGDLLTRIGSRGKFSELGAEDEPRLARLLEGGLIVKQDEGYTVALPTDSRFASFL
jgi:hypothetical protein